MIRRRRDHSALLGTLTVAAVVVAVFGIRLAIAGGDLGSLFAQDPVLCVVLKGEVQ